MLTEKAHEPKQLLTLSSKNNIINVGEPIIDGEKLAYGALAIKFSRNNLETALFTNKA
jgi:hypothetical protein